MPEPKDNSIAGLRKRAKAAKKRGVRYIYVNPEMLLPMLALYESADTISQALNDLNEARARVTELETWIFNKDYDLVEEGLLPHTGDEEEWPSDWEDTEDGDEEVVFGQ